MKILNTFCKVKVSGIFALTCILIPAVWLAGIAQDQLLLRSPELKILERKAGELVVQVNFPAVQPRSSAFGTILSMGDLPRIPDSRGRLLPAYRLLIPGQAKDLSVQVLETDTAILPLDQTPGTFSGDQRISASGQLDSMPSDRNHNFNVSASADWASIYDLGRYRGALLSVLQIQPVRWNERTHEATYLRSITLRLQHPTDPQPGQRRTTLSASLRTLTGSLPLPAFAGTLPLPPPASTSTAQTRLKIYVSEDGLYHINAGDLASWGVNLSGVDPRTIRLENRGEEQPIYVFGEADGRFDEGDYIEFWGEKLIGTYIDQNPEIYGDLYTDVNVYWLSWGESLGARLIEESGEVVEVDELKMFRATSYPYFTHFEENNYYDRLSQVSPDSLKEHWYYDNGVKASQTRNYLVHLPYPDTDALTKTRVRTALMGQTYPDDYGQGGYHHAYVSLNDQNSPALEAGSSGASWWVGQTGVILDAQGDEGISPSNLVHGTNQFSIFVPVDTDAGEYDTILLNWFEITYPRLYKADGDMIRFTPPDAAVDTLVDFKIEGFSSSQIDLFKLGQSKIINAEITPYQTQNQTRYKIHFQDRPYGDREYIALTPAAKLAPDSASAVENADLLSRLSAGGAIKLLVIASPVFENVQALNDLISRRNATLGRTELVFINEVFDDFSYGIYSPQAIKDLLLALPTPPEFLLLVGDGSYDTRDKYGLGGNLIPAPYVQTKAYGAVASDYWYSLLDDDIIPDLAVGRISARTEDELIGYLQKLEEYETDPQPGNWRSKHLFVSGEGGVAGISFLSMSQDVISRLEDDILVERLATDPITSPFYGGTIDLIDLFDDGVLVVDYNGHGAGAVWSDNSLFRLENLPQLSNQGKYPFITNFTCFIGAFDTPEQGLILGEEFIFEPEKGAIGVLASTGLGWFINGGWLQEELVGLLYDDPELCLGELINLAKISYYAYYGQGGSVESFDTMYLMNLLGDPSVKLAFASLPDDLPDVTPEFASEGDSISIVLPGDFENYQGILRVYDDYDYPALQFGQPFEYPLSASEEGLQADFVLPSLGDSVSLTGGTYRLSLWEPSGADVYHVAAPLYLLDAYTDTSAVDSLTSIPSPVYDRDAFGFKAKVLNAQGVDSVWAHFHIESDEGIAIVEHDSLPMNPMAAPNWYQTTTTIDTSMYPYGVGDRVIAWVKTTDAQGDTASSEELIFYILDSRPDPAWVYQSLNMGMRENAAALIIEVENLGQALIDSLDIGFYLTEPENQPLGSAIIYDLEPEATAEAYIPSNLNPGEYGFEVRMNENGWVDDSDPTDPYAASLIADHFTVSTSTGTGDTLTLSDDSWAFRVFIPPGGISGDQGVITFRQVDDLELPVTQSNLSFVLQDPSGFLPGLGFEIDLLGDIEIVGDSLKLAVDLAKYDTLSVLEDMAIHYRAPGQPLWQLLNTDVQTLSSPPDPNYRFSSGGHFAGAYTLLQNGDKQGPTVEISVEGQIYTPGGYVPSHPKISALIQDPGGVSAAPGTYWISVDDTVAVDSNLISVNVDESGQVLTLSFNPTFDVGSHSVFVFSQDLAGNAGSASIQFQVMGQFRLDFVGNYPNPFKNKTYFVYRLTEQTTEPVRIQVYTVSGRLIRTLHSDSAEEINYGEIYWDGRDQDGANIANGVYFYKLKARRGDQEIERTMKLAKLR